jgi:hypothetical protein
MEKKFSPLVALIAAADNAESTAFAACRTAAAEIFKRAKKGAAVAEEYKRLMTESFEMATKEGLVLAHRNTRLHIGQHLLIAFEPAMMIDTAAKEKDTILKPAAQCKTAREVASAAKQIREGSGMSDGRAKNKPAQKTKPANGPSMYALVEAALREKSTREKLFAVIRAAGYDVAPAAVQKIAKPAKVQAAKTKPAKPADVVQNATM